MRRRVGVAGCPENVNGKVFLAQLWKGFIHCTHCVLNPMTLFNVQSQSGELEKSLAGAYAFSPNGSSLPGKEGAGQLRGLHMCKPRAFSAGVADSKGDTMAILLNSVSFHEALHCFCILHSTERDGSCTVLTRRPVVSYHWRLMRPSRKFTITSRGGPHRGMRHAARRGARCSASRALYSPPLEDYWRQTAASALL